MVTSTRQEFQLLITDDNAAFRQVLREVLEDRPFLILHEAESGKKLSMLSSVSESISYCSTCICI